MLPWSERTQTNPFSWNGILHQLQEPRTFHYQYYGCLLKLTHKSVKISRAYFFFPKDMQNLTLCRAHWDSDFSNFNPVIETESQGYHSRILTF